MIEVVLLKNLTTLEEVKLTKDGDGILVLDDEGIDWGTVKNNISTYETQVGSMLSGMLIDTRTVSITGWIYGTAESINEMQVKLSKIINPNNELRIVAGNYYIDSIPSRVIQFGKKMENNNEYFCQFNASLFCPKPYFTSTSLLSNKYTELHPKFNFPFHFAQSNGVVFSYQEKVTLRSILNEGDSNVGAKITIKCLGEQLVNPKLFNIYNESEFVAINKTLEYGEQVVINTQLGEQDVKGILDGVESDYFKYWDYEGTWIQFPQGTKMIGLSAESGIENFSCVIELATTQFVIKGM